MFGKGGVGHEREVGPEVELQDSWRLKVGVWRSSPLSVECSTLL